MENTLGILGEPETVVYSIVENVFQDLMNSMVAISLQHQGLTSDVLWVVIFMTFIKMVNMLLDH